LDAIDTVFEERTVKVDATDVIVRAIDNEGYRDVIVLREVSLVAEEADAIDVTTFNLRTDTVTDEVSRSNSFNYDVIDSSVSGRRPSKPDLSRVSRSY
jgi:hypothetical protein